MWIIIRAGIGFLCCLWMLQPMHAQSTPAQSTMDEQCQGSTVDSQGPETATAARAFLAELQAAVKANDKAKIARMVSYPMNFVQGTKRVHIRDKQTFLARYDTIFTEHVRTAILAQSSHCLFGNANGEMVGHGEVWFTELGDGSVKIITVNTSSGM
ncbi:hypothetical protein H7849_20140 [Alloacidobacterium dinghuense]|uniref:Nuclear transport factor 2 family protein n=1 Tax=Alloacidobacterium dinghuense TaxID=2763107 RepID=A0A7G8BFP7_9BACT|nr:hypothetical protein [Alloacidobacterium dinghuense]QNI31367.1 hypothetical protein H7849_20140 [Alloacidobacterium dinghuense]